MLINLYRLLNFNLLSLLILFSFSCSKSTNLDSSNNIGCVYEVIIDDKKFLDPPYDRFSYIWVSVTGDCLKIIYQYNGCGVVSSSLISLDFEKSVDERFIRFAFENKSPCNIQVIDTVFFDISKLKSKRLNSLKLIIDEYPLEFVKYDY